MESLARLVTVNDEELRRLLDNIPVGIGVAESVEPDSSIKPEARLGRGCVACRHRGIHALAQAHLLSRY